MSDDTTTREAVERVRAMAGHFDALAANTESGAMREVYARDRDDLRTIIAALEDALEDCDDLGAVLTLAQQEAATVDSNHRAEVDAATTAERDRIRNAIEKRKRDEVENEGAHDPTFMDGYYRGLADAKRIIDAGP